MPLSSFIFLRGPGHFGSIQSVFLDHQLSAYLPILDFSYKDPSLNLWVSGTHMPATALSLFEISVLGHTQDSYREPSWDC